MGEFMRGSKRFRGCFLIATLLFGQPVLADGPMSIDPVWLVDSLPKTTQTSARLSGRKAILYSGRECVLGQPLSPCNYYVANVLQRGWGLNDFLQPPKSPLVTREMVEYVQKRPQKWVFLGNASNQQALLVAQKAANKGYPVIALKSGHVALVIPEEVGYSPSWKLKVPRIAQFSIGKPEKSYVGALLSLGWSAPQKSSVNLYLRRLP